jgi:phage shock protein E
MIMEHAAGLLEAHRRRPGKQTKPGGAEMYQPTINEAEARELIELGAQLIDVRNPNEYRHNPVPGSVNIPLPVIQQALKQLDKEAPVLLYCNSGQRSGVAKRLLDACGFSMVHNLGSYTTLIGRG